MSDAIETIGNSLVQHGSGNDWAYLMKLHATDAPQITEQLDQLASSRGYSKLCAKVPGWEAGRFVAAGYHMEAAIPYFFPEGGSACFMAKYFDPDRKLERQPQLVQQILLAAATQQQAGAMPLPVGFSMRQAKTKDAEAIAALYREVFSARPLTIHNPACIAAAIKEGTAFFGVWRERSLVALASVHSDPASSSAELSNFATLAGCRGKGIALHLLQQMEAQVLPLGIRSVFGTARAYSFSNNLSFARNGYRFGGTLTNNTTIYGKMESVNLWHKALPDDPRFAWKSLYETDSKGIAS